MNELTKYSPKVNKKFTSFHPDWWKLTIKYNLTARERLALMWYWMKGTNEDLQNIKHVFVTGSRATQWRTKNKLKKLGIFPTETKEVYTNR